MTAQPKQGLRGDSSEGLRPAHTTIDDAVVMGAVREDIRQTLRTGWLDPGIEAAAGHSVFFTAAWSAIRPNVGKSFLSLARRLRTDAVDAVRVSFGPADLRKRLEGRLSEEELRRVEESARAAQLAMAKSQIVVHALHRVARRERIPGTGREEPPVRRGVPDWQRWMSSQPAPGPARAVLDEAAQTLATPVPPVPLRLLARWPSALEDLWQELRPSIATEPWASGVTRLRRVVLAGITTLPHPVDLQWTALKDRGFAEEDRLDLVGQLAAHDAAMPALTLTAAFLWLAFGAPEIGVEG